MAPSLKRGAHLHFATDVEEYAHQAYNTLKKHSDWHDLHNGFAPRPTWRPLSTYEHKGITEGRTIFDLSFEFRPSTYIEEQQKIQT
jgi:tRNA (guanine-N7-)-methyltransferase